VLAVEEAAATEMAAASIADGAAMPDVAAVPFAGFLAFNESFLGGGTAAIPLYLTKFD
jgi:hypothetical protein